MAAQEGGEDKSSSDQEVEEMEEYSSTSYIVMGNFIKKEVVAIRANENTPRKN